MFWNKYVRRCGGFDVRCDAIDDAMRASEGLQNRRALSLDHGRIQRMRRRLEC